MPSPPAKLSGPSLPDNSSHRSSNQTPPQSVSPCDVEDTRRAFGAAGDVETRADHLVTAPAAGQAARQRHLEEVVGGVHAVLVQPGTEVRVLVSMRHKQCCKQITAGSIRGRHCTAFNPPSTCYFALLEQIFPAHCENFAAKTAGWLEHRQTQLSVATRVFLNRRRSHRDEEMKLGERWWGLWKGLHSCGLERQNVLTMWSVNVMRPAVLWSFS